MSKLAPKTLLYEKQFIYDVDFILIKIFSIFNKLYYFDDNNYSYSLFWKKIH